MQYHLAHIVPGKTLHGLHGYKDVIDTLQWGLEQLGHSVTYGLNELSGTARNVVFGAHLLDEDVVRRLPRETIVYNFEQGRGRDPSTLKPQLRIAAERFEVWDYSEANLSLWERLGALRAEVVPVGYAPILERVPRAAEQDIDVLLYGVPGQDRLGAFYHLCMAGLTCVFVCGLYGRARDELIGRSKLVLNINLYQDTKIFEVVRCSYLMANRKAIVADIDADTFIESDIRQGIHAVASEALVDACKRLCADAVERRRLEEAGHAVMVGRDIRKYLREVIDP